MKLYQTGAQRAAWQLISSKIFRYSKVQEYSHSLRFGPGSWFPSLGVNLDSDCRGCRSQLMQQSTDRSSTKAMTGENSPRKATTPCEVETVVGRWLMPSQGMCLPCSFQKPCIICIRLYPGIAGIKGNYYGNPRLLAWLSRKWWQGEWSCRQACAVTLR